MKHKKEIHVLYIITKLELGGAQKVCLSLMHGLRSNNANSILISGNEGPLVESVKELSEIHLLPTLKNNRLPRLGDLQAFWQLIKKIHTLKKKYPHLIVHTHSTKAGLWGRWAALFAGVKTRVHTIHGYGFHQHIAKPLWWLLYSMELITSYITTHYICVSSADVKTGIKLFPQFEQKHSIIRAGINWQQFYKPALKTPQFPLATEPFVFGTIACFKPQKNIFDLLKAFKLVRKEHPNTRLEIIGDGALRPALEIWIAKNNLEKYITLHGWQKNVAPIMSTWHAFALSSLWEGLPCAIVEARLLKLPVISYDTGGIHDVIINKENGFLCTQKAWRELADKMLALCKDKPLHTKMSNYKEDLSDFDHEHMIEQHLALYKNLQGG